ncbi:MAG TPA: hypothetical protein ENI29_10570 [bacterium]|nr:hypothetical protein [bacterium]
MELFQILWGDQNNLFLEFKKDEKEKQLFLPKKIKRVTLQFEISKCLKQEIYYKNPPDFISVKNVYHSAESLSVSFELDELINFDDLQIKILRITIFLYSGERFKYHLTQSFKIADINFNEDCYSGLEYENLALTKHVRSTITPEGRFQNIKTIIHESVERQTVIYEKKQFEVVSNNDSLMSLISEGNKTLIRIEQELKNLSSTMVHNPQNYSQYIPRTPMIRSLESGIERIKKPTKPTLMQGQITSSTLMVIKEMKSIFKSNKENNSDFNIQDILKPLSEDELNKITLDDEELEKKEEIAIQNQIKRFKKHSAKEIQVENLTPPK